MIRMGSKATGRNLCHFEIPAKVGENASVVGTRLITNRTLTFRIPPVHLSSTLRSLVGKSSLGVIIVVSEVDRRLLNGAGVRTFTCASYQKLPSLNSFIFVLLVDGGFTPIPADSKSIPDHATTFAYTPYIEADPIEEHEEKVKAAGGKVLKGKISEWWGTVAECLDTEGNRFFLYTQPGK